jgi:hypothetical protein
MQKSTVACTPHLIEYVKHPLVPGTIHDLERLSGRLKSSRHHVTGRTNSQVLILREKRLVGMLLGLPQTTNGVDAFPSVNLNDFHQARNLLR